MTDKKIPYFLALAPILFLIILLSINVVMYDDPIGGSNQLALLLSGALAAVIGLYYGNKWKDMPRLHNVFCLSVFRYRRQNRCSSIGS